MQAEVEVSVRGRWFTDQHGRVLMLRGVNLSGNTKIPYKPDIGSHIEEGFFDSENISFVGRPFPLEEADEHFLRLKRWGFTLLRFLTTWEAIEHRGPGQYDDEYVLYVVEVLKVAKRHGFVCFIDPHQDVWSRFTGGSGAPGWTLALAGLDYRHFKHNDAAIVHNTWTDSTNKREFPKMIWPTNYTKYACATMFTLFFGGRTFAPKCLVDGVNIQDYLQSHFINAIAYLASHVRDLGIVLGYDTLNEPSRGFIGVHDVRSAPTELTSVRLNYYETPVQAMVLASGYTTFVPYYMRSMFTGNMTQSGNVQLNQERESAFLPGRTCVWHDHGVWQVLDEATMASRPEACVKLPGYFSRNTKGEPYNFQQDFWLPFAARYAEALRKVHPGCAIFVEPEAMGVPAKFEHSGIVGPLVYAPHWYDGLTLFQKSFSNWSVNIVAATRGVPWYRLLALGELNVIRLFKASVATLKAEGLENVGEYPIVFGETGIPFDMNNGAAFVTGDFSQQTHAANATLSAMESNLVNFTLWNYCASNNNLHGDSWNGEDFSIYSVDQARQDAERERQPQQPDEEGGDKHIIRRAVSFMSGLIGSPRKRASPYVVNELDYGGRALPAVIRPYAMKTAGTPTYMTFDPFQGVFEFRFVHKGPATDRASATEIFLPQYHFGNEDYPMLVHMSDGKYEYDPLTQILLYTHADLTIGEHYIRVIRSPAARLR